MCDLLLMSATPIPRTLSIALYGDLDVSSLDNYPFEKKRVETFVFSFSDARIFSTINECLKDNRQVFIIAPRIQDNNSLYSVEKLYDYFSSIYEGQVYALSSKNKSKEKEEIISSFKKGERKILISTTVVELGLNVLSAGAIIIYEASRFGLASLHQLRGRVGRDGQDATCLLLDDKETERLRIMEKVYDGASLSYEDLKLRGSGDFLGEKQSGFPSFKTVNVIDDFKMFTYARNDALYMLNNMSNIEFERYVLYVRSKMKKEENEIIRLVEA